MIAASGGALLTGPAGRERVSHSHIMMTRICVIIISSAGPCVSSSECETGGGYYICSNECVDRLHYPLDQYPTLAQIYGYQSGYRLQKWNRLGYSDHVFPR